jgi:hypothetical protein
MTDHGTTILPLTTSGLIFSYICILRLRPIAARDTFKPSELFFKFGKPVSTFPDHALEDIPMMKLYFSPRSRSFSALWLMEETGQPYERVLTDLSAGAQKAPEYLAINPMGKVPALKDGDATLGEAAAICAYVAPNICTGCSSRRVASSRR